MYIMPHFSVFMSSEDPVCERAAGKVKWMQVGALLVRGYAFQTLPQPSQAGLNIVPRLSQVGHFKQ